MARLLTCPTCSGPLQVPESLLGQSVRCPSCRGIFQASADGESLQPQEPVATSSPSLDPESPLEEPSEQPPADVRVLTDPSSEYTPCPFCREMISSRASRCEFCGERMGGYRPRHFRRDVLPHRGSIILVFGILSLVASPGFLACPVLFNLIGIGLGATAWLMGNHDLARIMRGEMDPAGQSTTKSGRNCGIIGLILNIVLLLLCAGMLLLMFIGPQLGRF